ncbi:MAG: hypothetical protein IJT54_01485, partial [Candidatus Methanomethylophilaceae archaeon]|nr:hypothetical protein [Candidatus Methanomethylophilaceae archaeon]
MCCGFGRAKRSGRPRGHRDRTAIRSTITPSLTHVRNVGRHRFPEALRTPVNKDIRRCARCRSSSILYHHH